MTAGHSRPTMTEEARQLVELIRECPYPDRMGVNEYATAVATWREKAQRHIVELEKLGWKR